MADTTPKPTIPAFDDCAEVSRKLANSLLAVMEVRDRWLRFLPTEGRLCVETAEADLSEALDGIESALCNELHPDRWETFAAIFDPTWNGATSRRVTFA